MSSYRNSFVALGFAAMVAFAAPAVHAQALGGRGATVTIASQAKVIAIDPKTREITLHGAAGDEFRVVAGPEVQNFDQIHVGDDVVARYTQSIVLVLSDPNTTLPQDSITAAAARAKPGTRPGAAVAQQIVLTGTVVGIDMASHQLSIVDPTGGAVHVVTVRDPARQRAMARVKVGDSITAIYSEGVAVSVEPVTKKS